MEGRGTQINQYKGSKMVQIKCTIEMNKGDFVWGRQRREGTSHLADWGLHDKVSM